MHARDYQPGEHVPGTVYQVVRLIGAGGMGTVYDVEDTTIGKRYVLKTLHPQLGAREDLARRMQNEARTLARLNHPNIVEVFTAGVTGDDLRLPYYVMERLNGQSLRVVLEKKKRLERQHAYHIGIDLLDALDHAHDKGVIHRDVKPDNIFLHRSPSGVTLTKLLDFGIVSVLDSGTRETAGRFLGTLRYAAPEQLRGEKPTPKTDVYSAGLVLYEVLAGRGPFDDEGDPHRIGGAHLNRLAPPLSRFVAVPRELEALLMAALAKDPALRPRDAFSFAASLRNLKRNQHGSIPPEVAPADDAATVPSSLGATTTRLSQIELLTPSPKGPYVVTTATSSSTITPTRFPNTTIAEMVVPTSGQSVLTSSITATESTSHPPADPEWIDREAATRSQPPPAPRSFAGETAAMTAAPPADAPRLVAVPTPDAFPDRSAFFSEGPQVRSLHAAAAARRPWPAVAAGVFGVAALLSLGALVVVLHNASGAHAGPATLAAAGVSPIPPPPSATPVLVLPAPTLDMGALDAPVSSGTSVTETPGRVPSEPAAEPPPNRSAPVHTVSLTSIHVPIGAPSVSAAPSPPPAASAKPPAVSGAVAPRAATAAATGKAASAGSAHDRLDRPGPGF